jgi:hypothetical protein
MGWRKLRLSHDAWSDAQSQSIPLRGGELSASSPKDFPNTSSRFPGGRTISGTPKDEEGDAPISVDWADTAGHLQLHPRPYIQAGHLPQNISGSTLSSCTHRRCSGTGIRYVYTPDAKGESEVQAHTHMTCTSTPSASGALTTPSPRFKSPSPNSRNPTPANSLTPRFQHPPLYDPSHLTSQSALYQRSANPTYYPKYTSLAPLPYRISCPSPLRQQQLTLHVKCQQQCMHRLPEKKRNFPKNTTPPSTRTIYRFSD